MPQHPARSLKHEYELFVDEEIENYKESVPRSVLLSIGDEAVTTLAIQQQLALTELLLCEEVDRIIFRRLRLPSYSTWRRRRVKQIEELRRPERWGLHPDDVVVRALHPGPDGHVLVAGTADEAALYLAANGCEVTALDRQPDAIDRVLQAALAAGLAERVHAIDDLASWSPASQLSAVIVTPDALSGLTAAQRARVIELLKSATLDGGVHLVKTLAAGKKAMTLDELRSRYRGWTVSIEGGNGHGDTFLARKESPSS